MNKLIKDKIKYYEKLKKEDKNRECPICNKIVYKNDEFEVIVNRRKNTRLYHTGCILEELKNGQN